MQFPFKNFARREDSKVLGYVDARLPEFQHLDLFAVGFGTEDEAERKRLALFPLELCQPPEVELHLAFVFGPKLPELQIDSDQTLQLAVIKEQVDIEVIPVELEALLAGNERKPRSKFQKEAFDLSQDRVLQIPLQVVILQFKEVKDVRTP